MIVVIPAAGEGKRLKSISGDTPKPLVPIAGKPMICHILNQLVPVRRVIESVVIVVRSYEEMALFETVAASTGRFLPYRFCIQPAPLGAGDAVCRAVSNIGVSGRDVLVMYSDTFTNASLLSFVLTYTRWHEDCARMTLMPKTPGRGGYAFLDDQLYLKEIYEGQSEAASVYPKECKYAPGSWYYFPESRILRLALESLRYARVRTKNEYQMADALAAMLWADIPIQTMFVGETFDMGTPEGLKEAEEFLRKRTEANDGAAQA